MATKKSSNIELLDADLVVAGGGGAGLSAAITGKEFGIKRIIVLEKRKVPGGNSSFVEGIFGAESPAQKRLGIDAQKDELFKKAMRFSHWKTNPRLLRLLVDNSADTIRWLEDRGLYFDRIYPLFPGQSPMTFHFSGAGFAGPKLVNALVKNCENLGIKLLCESRAKKILTDAGGVITGVVAAKKDKEIRISTKSLIIATGGFAGSKKLMRKYFPGYNKDTVRYHGLPHTGDGLLMAMEIGVATEGLGTFELGGPFFQWSTRLNLIARDASTVWINKNGERFTDEAVAFHFPESGNALNRQPEKTCYALLSEEIKNRIIGEGLISGGIGFLSFLKKDMNKNELESSLIGQADKGRIKISNSWSDIAQWIGADSEVLINTVDQYNKYCDKGHDDYFLKEPRYLVPLRTPPYSALRCCQSIYNTLGGIKINHFGEALDKQDIPIPGLYAAGADSGGWEADTYNHLLTGHSISFSISTGRIAGQSAANFLSQGGFV